ncbi:MAG: ABC transporter permease [Actinomycetota bacterium]
MTATTPRQQADASVDATPVAIDEVETGSGPPGLGVGFWLAVAFLGLIALIAVLAPWLPFLDDPDAFSRDDRLGPSTDYWFGTDELGRDVFSRTMFGARVSLQIAVLAVVAGMLVGGSIGLLAGFLGGRIDRILSGAMDVLLAFPPLVLALFVVAVRGATVANVVLALSVLSVPGIARIVRANTVVFANREFVTAAETLGAKRSRILVKEILPNVVPAMLAFSLLIIGLLIIAEGALSFLGLSVADPYPSWGGILASGRLELDEAPHIALFTILLMFLTVLSLNVVSDTLQQRFSVREAAI